MSPVDAPLVSVVVPAYNAQSFVAATLNALVAQTFHDFEVIVVDDGSSDATPEIVAQFAAEDRRFRVIRTRNGGVASARNRGLSEARGEFVAFLDADDLWHPTKLARQIEVLSKRDDGWGAVYAFHRLIDENGRILKDGKQVACSGFVFARHIVMQLVGNGSTVLVRRRAALEVGGFDPSYARMGCGGCEDFDFELKLAARYQMDVVPEFLVGYRKYEGNMSSDRDMMSRALPLTIDRNAGRMPNAPIRVRRWADAAVLRYVMRHHLAKRDIRGAVSTFVKAMWADPAYGTCLLATSAARGAGRQVHRMTARGAGETRGKPFLDATPVVIGGGYTPCEAMRLRQLKAIDRAFEPAKTVSGALDNDEV